MSVGGGAAAGARDCGEIRTRLDQIIDWLQGDGGEADFDGLILLDEIHRAKNLVPTKPGEKKGTKTGRVVAALQRRLAAARVVYASATAASEPHHLAPMPRLGLWGESVRADDDGDDDDGDSKKNALLVRVLHVFFSFFSSTRNVVTNEERHIRFLFWSSTKQLSRDDE